MYAALELNRNPASKIQWLPEGRIGKRGSGRNGTYDRGVLLAMDNDVPVGSMVDFTILLPAEVIGFRRDVQIDCRGRVVRSFEDRGRRAVGVVIDEYHFERT